MNLKLSVSAFLTFATSVLGNVPKADYYYHQPIISPSMWVFGADGVSMYSKEGEMVKNVPAEDFCVPTADRSTGEMSSNCGFRGVASDGINYVFATNSAGGAFVEVFAIDTGIHVASLPTCGFPWNIDFNPSRQEIWVQCWSPDEEDGDEGHIDIFSSAALSIDMNQVVTGSMDLRGHGTVIVDSSLPNVAFANVLSSPNITMIDANTKRSLADYELPGVSGLYRMEYSHANKHIFMRAYICCSCGFEGADLGTQCGRGTPRFVDVISGPNQATNVTGKCGHSCEGSPADTLGVYEWDTQSKELVGSHVDSRGLAADPWIDPAGRYLILLANDGGNQATIVKTGANGVKSETLQVLDTGFSTVDGEKGISDVCFIENDVHNIAIFISTLANFVIFADMSGLENGGTIATKKIWLTAEDASEITANHGRGARRNCAWAFGSDYVWVDAQKAEMVHIIKLSPDGDITKAEKTKDIEGVPSRLMHWVYNHKAEAISEQIMKTLKTEMANIPDNGAMLDLINQNIVLMTGNVNGITGDVSSLTGKVTKVTSDMNGLKTAVGENKASVQAAASDIAGLKTDAATVETKEVNEVNAEAQMNGLLGDIVIDSDPSTIAVAGLAVGVCASVLGLVNLVMLCKR